MCDSVCMHIYTDISTYVSPTIREQRTPVSVSDGGSRADESCPNQLLAHLRVRSRSKSEVGHEDSYSQ